MEFSDLANIQEVAQALKARLSMFADTPVLLMAKKRTAPAPLPADPKTVAAVQQLLQQNHSPRVRLELLKDQLIGDCQRCSLHLERGNLVFGVGSENADLVFVGEAPGAEEDRLGEPFVGRSGKLLTKMIEAMGLSRSEVYICNVIKCQPPGNRNPDAVEVAECEPFLKAQLAILRPKVIVALGRFACQSLASSGIPISELRGVWSSYEGIDLMPTFHPAYLLRNPSKKKEVWEDLQAVMDKLGLPGNK